MLLPTHLYYRQHICASIKTFVLLPTRLCYYQHICATTNISVLPPTHLCYQQHICATANTAVLPPIHLCYRLNICATANTTFSLPDCMVAAENNVYRIATHRVQIIAVPGNKRCSMPETMYCTVRMIVQM